MKIKDAEIILVPGYTGSGPDHWQSRWETKIASAHSIRQADWFKPVLEDWTAVLVAAIDEATKPIVLVAHSLGCQVVVQASQQFSENQKAKVKGAFLVAPPDVENPSIKPKHLMTFGPYPRTELPFPSVVVASRDDRFCDFEVAEKMAKGWQSRFVDARESGHINSDSGHGPWPDGLMVFAGFMKSL